jgi:hypothetical protein
LEDFLSFLFLEYGDWRIDGRDIRDIIEMALGIVYSVAFNGHERSAARSLKTIS